MESNWTPLPDYLLMWSFTWEKNLLSCWIFCIWGDYSYSSLPCTLTDTSSPAHTKLSETLPVRAKELVSTKKRVKEGEKWGWEEGKIAFIRYSFCPRHLSPLFWKLDFILAINTLPYFPWSDRHISFIFKKMSASTQVWIIIISLWIFSFPKWK